MKYSISEVKASFSGEKREREFESNLFGYLLYRQLSFILTPIVLSFSVPAMAVSLLSLFIVFCMPLIALSGAPYAFVYLFLFAWFYHILDYIDGNVARVTGTTSKLGTYLDAFAGNCYWLLLFLSIGLLVDSTELVNTPYRGVGLILGLSTGILNLLARDSRNYAKMIGSDDNVQFVVDRSSRKTWLKVAVSVMSSLGYLTIYILLISGFFKLTFLSLLFGFSYFAAILVYSQYKIIRVFA